MTESTDSTSPGAGGVQGPPAPGQRAPCRGQSSSERLPKKASPTNASGPHGGRGGFSISGPRRLQGAVAGRLAGIPNLCTPDSARPVLASSRPDDPLSVRHLFWPALCAAPSRVVPRVSTAARPHDNKGLDQFNGAGSCHARRGVATAGRIHTRSERTSSSCVSRRLSRGPRCN